MLTPSTVGTYYLECNISSYVLYLPTYYNTHLLCTRAGTEKINDGVLISQELSIPWIFILSANSRRQETDDSRSGVRINQRVPVSVMEEAGSDNSSRENGLAMQPTGEI